MNSGEPWRLGHRPGLDGLRGVAILLVLVSHLSAPWWGNALGSVGVTLFFTLSGFLITALLLGEKARRGRVSWSGFYRRRAARLLPALGVMLAVVGPVQVLGGFTPLRRVLAVAFYVGNWPLAAGHGMVFLRHMWSLGIEEQFYLLWPVVLLVSCRWRNGPLAAAGVGILTATALRFVLWDGGSGSIRVYAGTDTRMDALLIGCLVAILLHRGVIVRIPVRLVPVLLSAALALGLSTAPWVGNLLIPTVVPWLGVAVVLGALNTSPGWMSGPWLCGLGRRSYGIYLWHYPLMRFAYITTHSFAACLVALVAGLVVAELSWRWVEQPFLRRDSATDASEMVAAVRLRTAMVQTTMP